MPTQRIGHSRIASWRDVEREEVRGAVGGAAIAAEVDRPAWWSVDARAVHTAHARTLWCEAAVRGRKCFHGFVRPELERLHTVAAEVDRLAVWRNNDVRAELVRRHVGMSDRLEHAGLDVATKDTEERLRLAGPEVLSSDGEYSPVPAD